MPQPIDPNIQAEYNMNRDLQQQKIEGEQSTAMGNQTTASRQNVQAALLEQLDPNRVVENIELALRGKMKDPVTGEIKEIRTPLMNEMGIGNIISSVISIVNASTTISAVDERMINRMVCSLSEEIGNDLELNWKSYAITNKSNLDRIDGICKRMVYLCLRRSLQGGERRFLGTTTMETISTPRMQQPQRPQKWYHKFKL